MDKAAKLILNSLRCPVCKSQIDLLDYTSSRKPKQFNYCCASNSEHYGLWFIHWAPPTRIEFETVIVYDTPYQYEIRQTYFNSVGDRVDTTAIIVREVDLENRIIENIKSKLFAYHKCLFDFSKSSREKIINRIKTILVFQ